MTTALQTRIEALWDQRDALAVDDPEVQATIHEAIDLLDTGQARVASVTDDGDIEVHAWLKQAIMLLFRTAQMATTELGPFEYADKIPLKGAFASQGVRVVPGASARWGSYQAPGVVMMPSYVNIGAYVGENSMVDTWATVGSCAQIGRNVHLAGGVGIGGVLEPAVASPVVIEDEVFVGSRCMITEGSRVGEGAVVGSGVILNGSVPVVDASTGAEISRGEIPAWSVAVFATRPKEFPGGTFNLPCALVIKYLEPGERHDKSALNTVLRENGVAL